MRETIVTGVDGSETAAMAARKAAHLASALDADLHLVCAFGKFESTTFRSGEEEFLYTNEHAADETARKVAAELRPEFSGLKITAAPAEGDPGEALVHTAEKLNAQLIVVGNKRVQGIARVLGSVARDVAAHAPCDVYVAYTHERRS